jgi:membrane protein implicated in regulation of membrane protease activity
VVDSLVGQELLLLDDLAPGGIGKGELRGTTWNVRTAAPRTLRQGERARVTRVEGLTLWVEA